MYMYVYIIIIIIIVNIIIIIIVVVIIIVVISIIFFYDDDGIIIFCYRPIIAGSSPVEPTVTPPLRLQVSDCSTFRI